MSWQDQAIRALTMFRGRTDDHEASSWQIFNHVLNESNRDDYISHDFSKAQKTARAAGRSDVRGLRQHGRRPCPR